MERKEGLPIVVFDGDTDISEVKDIIPEGFEGDIIINGDLVDQGEDDPELNVKGGIFVEGNLQADTIDAELLYVGENMEVWTDLKVNDLICEGEASGSGINVAGDCLVESIYQVDEVNVLGNFTCDENIEEVEDGIFVNGEFSCGGTIYNVEKIEVKNMFF